MLYGVITGIHVNQKLVAQFLHLFAVDPPIDDNYETEACGIPQLETVDLETLSLFKSRTDLACLRDLLNAKCFIGKAHTWFVTSVHERLFQSSIC